MISKLIAAAVLALSLSLAPTTIEDAPTVQSATETPATEAPQDGPPNCATPPPWDSVYQVLACSSLYTPAPVPGCAAPSDFGPSQAGSYEFYFCSGYLPTPTPTPAPPIVDYPPPAYP